MEFSGAEGFGEMVIRGMRELPYSSFFILTFSGFPLLNLIPDTPTFKTLNPHI